MTEPLETHFGFKRITVENWQDAALPIPFGPARSEDWVTAHLQAHLEPTVPDDLTALFEVARGCMIYGWFFYPLITVGAEQCYRVLEAAVRTRCQNAGIPTTMKTKKGKTIRTSFDANIRALIGANIIKQANQEHWTAIRHLRNIGAHPEFQTILPPAVTLNQLELTADLLNQLFL